MSERRLELAVQICIDLGTQLVMETSARAPESYADVFQSMAEAGLLSTALADRMGEAARQRICWSTSTWTSTTAGSFPRSNPSTTCVSSRRPWPSGSTDAVGISRDGGGAS
jgi:hypothetical protein